MRSSGIIPLAPTKIGIRKKNSLVFLLNQTNLRKIEKETKGEKPYLALSSCAGPALCGLAGPVGRPGPPVPPPLSSSSPTGGRARARRARAPPRHTTSLSACLPSPLLVWMPRRRHAATPTSLALSLALVPLLCSLSRAQPSGAHRRRPP